MGVIGAYLLASLAFLVFAWLAGRSRHESVGGLDVYAFPSYLKWFFYFGTILSFGVVVYGITLIDSSTHIKLKDLITFWVLIAMLLCIFIRTIYVFLIEIMLTDHGIYRQRWRPVRFAYTEIQKILLTRQNAYVVGPGGKKIYISLMMREADDLIRKLHVRCPQAPFVDRITGRPIENF